MNEEKPKSENILNQNPKQEHPLHMLDNQADPENKPKIILQKSIRTYEGDVAEALAQRNTSVVSMAIAEGKKKSGVESVSNEVKSRFGVKMFMVILSILFVLAGLGGGYYLYLKSPLAPVPAKPTTAKINSMISPNSQKIIAIDNLSGGKLALSIQKLLIKENAGVDKINEYIFTQKIASTTVKVSGQKFINLLGLSMPDTLKRSIVNGWMFGVIGIDEIQSPFIILTTDFFQNAYAGMLNWESAMPDELSTVLNYTDKIQSKNTNGTSSIASFFTIKGNFKDKIIMNRDVREFYDASGQVLVLYSFIDNKTLVIATSEATLKGLIGKIEKQVNIR